MSVVLSYDQHYPRTCYFCVNSVSAIGKTTGIHFTVHTHALMQAKRNSGMWPLSNPRVSSLGRIDLKG